MDIPVVSEEEAAKATYVICVRKADATAIFDDNLEAPCVACAETVVYRPYTPPGPAKLCMVCFIDMQEASLQ